MAIRAWLWDCLFWTTTWTNHLSFYFLHLSNVNNVCPGCWDVVIEKWQMKCRWKVLCKSHSLHKHFLVAIFLNWGITYIKCTDLKIKVWVLTFVHTCVTIHPSRYGIFLLSPKVLLCFFLFFFPLMFLTSQLLPLQGNHCYDVYYCGLLLLFQELHINGILQCVFLCVRLFFTQKNTFEMNPYCAYQYFIPTYSYTV